MATKNITLTGAELAVTGLDGAHAHIRNDSAAVIYAAKTPGITAGADGVMSIPAGASATVYSIPGTVYLLGNGAATVITSDYTDSPFRNVSNGGAADIVTDAAASVTLDGLQGGVPFSDITLSGDIVGQEVTVRACGKNLIPFAYKKGTYTTNGITFTVNDDGSVSAVGTATADTYFFLAQQDYLLYQKGKQFTLSGCPAGGGKSTYSLYYSLRNLNNVSVGGHAEYGEGVTFTLSTRPDVNALSVTIVIYKGVTIDAVFRPQLERGAKATEYEPYCGTEVAITPDSNPYTVPNDIRQQDGINNVSVSAGEVSVTGVKRNAALKKIWDKLDELTAAIIVSNGEI